MILGIGLGAAALLAGLLGFAATKPDRFRVQRSAMVNAPPERIFPLLNDFRSWTRWSPWEEIDPDLKREYSGPDAGKGASYRWEGKKAGAGSMEIIDSQPPSRLAIDLVFTRPFKAKNLTEFTITPVPGGTKVDWHMSGDNTYAGKVMSVFIEMDRMVGKDFEKGLATLKSEAEKDAAGSSAASPQATPSPT